MSNSNTANTTSYQSVEKHHEILALLDHSDSLHYRWISKQELAWRDKVATNKFCNHGDQFKQTLFSTGEKQARMN